MRSGRIGAVEVVEHALERVDRLDRHVGAIVWRDDEATIAAARRIDDLARGGHDLPALAGVPMTVKDLLSISGQPATRSSLAFDEGLAEETDLVVERALGAGLVPLGRAASPELGMTTSCESDRWGITRNPWHADRSPGGSSGGPAAAVAAGLVPVALASDGGGSIRVPASFCGVVGLKPSRGLLPARVQGWADGAVEGAITRSIEDAAVVYSHLARPDRHGWTRHLQEPPDYLAALGRPTPKVRIGLLTTAFDPRIPVDAACAGAAEETADRLRSAGHEVVELEPIDAMAEVMDVYPRTIIPSWLAAIDVPHPDRLPAHVRRHLDHAERIGAATYVREVKLLRLKAREILHHLFDAVDVVLTPTTATRVPRIGAVREELLRHGGPLSRDCTLYERTLAFTTVPSIIGSPAISLPTHADDDGLPVGIQLIGEQFAESLLLGLGRDLQAGLGWLHRHPPDPIR